MRKAPPIGRRGAACRRRRRLRFRPTPAVLRP